MSNPKTITVPMQAFHVEASPGDMTRYQLTVFRTPAGWYVAWPMMDMLARWSPRAHVVSHATGGRTGDGRAYDCKAIAAILRPLAAEILGTGHKVPACMECGGTESSDENTLYGVRGGRMHAKCADPDSEFGRLVAKGRRS